MRELSEIATKSGPQRACPYHVCVSNENPQDASVYNIVHMYIFIYIHVYVYIYINISAIPSLILTCVFCS